MERLMEARFSKGMTKHTNTVVVGGTGKTGRRVVDRLRTRALPVRVASRSGEVPFDWARPETWPVIAQNAESMYLVYYPDLAFPGAAETIRDFCRVAVEHGVRRVVLLSGRGEEEAQVSEQQVRDIVPEWTILRASWLAQNFSEHFLLEPVLAGEIALPSGDVPEPFVDAEDIADMAVAALTTDDHLGRSYEATGPRLLTFADAAAEIAEATGREVQYLPVTAGQYAEAAKAAGLPDDEIAGLTDLFTRVLDGRNAHLSRDVELVLGRPARDFADYARRTAASGIWDR
jgi:uncharacterized protein YbjT (DUF2867 family)